MKKIKAQNIPFDIIYEDKYILIINKKADCIVHTNNSVKKNTVVNGLINHLKKPYNIPRSGLAHRLDKNTTGLMIITKDIQSQKNIMLQFRRKDIKKFYVAIVHGNLFSGGTIINTVKRDKKNHLKMQIVKNNSSQNAITHFRIIGKYEKYTLLNIKLETGKTHQIRIHFSDLRHPIVGDKLYNNQFTEKNRKNGMSYQMLHAKSLNFLHPKTGKHMSFFADIPVHFKLFLENLKRKT